VKPKKIVTKNIKLVGGPLGGCMVAVPRTAEKYTVGRGVAFWTYTYAGKVERQEMFAIAPRSRAGRRLLMHLIGETGKDPRLMGAQFKGVPVVNTGRVAHGRGAAKRRAKKAA